jgi:response regulator RpfG family c-di-GMP phosphodiesterase
VEPQQLVAAVSEYAALDETVDRVGVGYQLVLVDDNPIQRKLVRLVLERLGFSIRVADDGADALEIARVAPPDVIVSDVLMPRLDGFELCRAVREDSTLRAVPVILLSSSYVQQEDRLLADRVGASVLLERTPALGGLTDALRVCLSRSEAVKAPRMDFEAAHARRVRDQLERQVKENAELRQQLALNSIDLSVVAGISNMLTRSSDHVAEIGEALGRCLEVAGLSAGIALLRDSAGSLSAGAAAGPVECVAALRRRVAQIDQARFERSGIDELPSVSNQSAAVAVSLGSGSEPLGLLAITWGDAMLGEQRIAFARAIAGQLSKAIALRRAIDELDSAREETITRLALAAESRDGPTARHTERVTAYSALLAEQLGLGPTRTELIRAATIMHDVGKIGVSDTILLKPGRLTADEFEQMKRHTTIGHKILAGSTVELLDLAATIALTHHERIDGTGYPHGLIGDQIPIEGRIVAVADVFDALTTDRIYRPAYSVESAIEIMREGRGTQFDAHVLDLLLEHLDELHDLRSAHSRKPAHQ